MMETLQELVRRYPGLSRTTEEIQKAADEIIRVYRNGGTLFTCGNGGSAADADHIVGELMKGFLKKRPIPECHRIALNKMDTVQGNFAADHLQCGLPAISLHSQSALLTAFANDVDASMMYAQVLYAMGKTGDILLAISTSGNSANVVNAAKIAKLRGMTLLALTGNNPCKLDDFADVVVHVGEIETYRVQELHLPVYHWICAKVEETFFRE